MPQAAARTDDGDPLARPRAGFHEALVDGDARAEHRGDTLEVQVPGNSRHVRRLGHGVLLEGAVHCVPGQEGRRAQLLVALQAERAREARPVDPLDAGMVAHLDVIN